MKETIEDMTEELHELPNGLFKGTVLGDCNLIWLTRYGGHQQQEAFCDVIHIYIYLAFDQCKRYSNMDPSLFFYT
jgi:hypothetical protein